MTKYKTINVLYFPTVTKIFFVFYVYVCQLSFLLSTLKPINWQKTGEK